MTQIEIVTNKGSIKCNLFDDDAPMTVASLKSLISQGFYNGIVFHRVIANFMIQFGCPLGRGTGGPRDKGISSFDYNGQQVNYPYADEFNNGHVFDKPGILAMANAGPRTNGSQMFITHVPTPHLNNKHTILGEVVSADDQGVVNSIAGGDKIIEMKIL